ncbi:hypothetical protein D3C83_137410 [compost metagenome]
MGKPRRLLLGQAAPTDQSRGMSKMDMEFRMSRAVCLGTRCLSADPEIPFGVVSAFSSSIATSAW